MTTVNFERMQTLGDVTRVHAGERPDAIAFEFEGRSTSFAALCNTSPALTG